MRNGRLWPAVLAAVALAVPALGQDESVESLQERLRNQEARIQALEDAQAAATTAAATREEIRAIVRGILDEEGVGAADPLTFRASWNDGLVFTTADERFRLAIGGRAQWDWVWIDGGEALEESLGDLEDGTEFRRVRLGVVAVIYDNMEFALEVDFAGGNAALKDAYLRLMKVPCVGNLYVGHFNEPFGLETLTSNKYLTFMERALPTIFAPEENSGFMVGSAFEAFGDGVDRVTAAAGLFRDTDDFGAGAGDGGYNVTGRVTALPWYEDEGERLLHLGASYSFRSPEDPVRWRQRPEIHLSPRFVDTGDFAAEHVNLLGGEAAMVLGPVHLQGEYIAACSDLDDGGAEYVHGFYVQAGWFLTGEVRPYKNGAGVFGRVTPNRNFAIDGGPGAWELALRYSWLDLNDDALRGGELQDVTFGINWYLNPNVRILWNYIRACIADDDAADILGMRFQFIF